MLWGWLGDASAALFGVAIAASACVAVGTYILCVRAWRIPLKTFIEPHMRWTVAAGLIVAVVILVFGVPPLVIMLVVTFATGWFPGYAAADVRYQRSSETTQAPPAPR